MNRTSDMTIRRSEVAFIRDWVNHMDAAMQAKSQGKRYYALRTAQRSPVFDLSDSGGAVCRIQDLIDDRAEAGK